MRGQDAATKQWPSTTSEEATDPAQSLPPYYFKEAETATPRRPLHRHRIAFAVAASRGDEKGKRWGDGWRRELGFVSSGCQEGRHTRETRRFQTEIKINIVHLPCGAAQAS
jgi:hypothetical protein